MSPVVWCAGKAPRGPGSNHYVDPLLTGLLRFSPVDDRWGERTTAWQLVIWMGMTTNILLFRSPVDSIILDPSDVNLLSLTPDFFQLNFVPWLDLSVSAKNEPPFSTRITVIVVYSRIFSSQLFYVDLSQPCKRS